MLFTDFHFTLLKTFLDRKVDFILIGGHAAIFYGSSRTTGDMDLLVWPSSENGQKILLAFQDLQFEVEDLQASEFEHPLVLAFGFEPDGVDIINELKGVDLIQVFKTKILFPMQPDLEIPVVDARSLLLNKQSVNRSGAKSLTDLLDVLSLLKYLEINPKP